MRKKLHSAAISCGLKQIMTPPTRVATNISGTSSACTDHIFQMFQNSVLRLLQYRLAVVTTTWWALQGKLNYKKGAAR